MDGGEGIGLSLMALEVPLNTSLSQNLHHSVYHLFVCTEIFMFGFDIDVVIMMFV